MMWSHRSGRTSQTREVSRSWPSLWRSISSEGGFRFISSYHLPRASLVAQLVKNLPALQETLVRSLGRKDPLEKEMATHASTLAWRTPWTEEPGGCSPWGRRVGHDVMTHHLPRRLWSLPDTGWGRSTEESAGPADGRPRRAVVQVEVCRPTERTCQRRPRRVSRRGHLSAGLGVAEGGWAGACLTGMFPPGSRRRGQRWERRRTPNALVTYSCAQRLESLWARVLWWPVLSVPSVSKSKDFFFF